MICAVTNEARANTEESSEIRAVTSTTATKEASSEIRAMTTNTTATTESDGSPARKVHGLRDPFASPQRVHCTKGSCPVISTLAKTSM
jgi:hypothetical protein